MLTKTATEAATKEHRARRWVKRGLFGTLATVALVVAGALAAIHTDWGRGVLRAQVQRRIDTMFTGGAKLGRIEGSPFGQLTVHDVVINGPDHRPAISAKTLTIQLAILPLLSHQARVGAIVADDVDIDLRRDPDGTLQITRLMLPGPKSEWSVALPSVELRRAHLRVDTGREVMNFDALTLEARAKLPHGGPIDASLELHGSWRERQAAVLDVKTVVHSEPGRLALPYVMIQAGDVSVIGNQVTIVSNEGHAPAIGGTVIVRAAAAAVARLVPEVRLPADLAVMVNAAPLPDHAWTQLAVVGRVDGAPVWFHGAANLETRHARGELQTGELDVTKLSSGKLVGRGAARAVFDVVPGGPSALPTATATIHGWGAFAGVPSTAFDIAVTSAGERVRATVDATGDRTRVKLAGDLHRRGELLAIEGVTLHATTADPARASGGKAPVHGALRADLVASGTLRPALSLAVSGTVDGQHLRVQDLSVATLHLAIDAQRLPNRPLGHARVELTELVRGDMQLGALTVDATDRSDGKLAVSVRSRPKQNPWLLDADAIITPPAEAGPSTVVVDLQRHWVRAGNGTDWTGTTGHVEIGPERIAVRDFASASALGRLAIAGSYQRAGRRRGDLAANVDAAGLSLDSLGGGYHGKLDAHVAVARRGGAWEGEVTVDGSRLSIERSIIPVVSLPPALATPPIARVAAPAAASSAPAAVAPSAGAAPATALSATAVVAPSAGGAPSGPGAKPAAGSTTVVVAPATVVVDAHAHATLHGEQLALTADAASAGLGSAKLAVELATPAAITDPRAWKRLGRDALRAAELTLRGVEVRRAAELAGLDGEYTGRIDGDFKISPDAAGGRLELHNLVAPQLRGLGGTKGVTATFDLSQTSPTELAPALTVRIEGVGQLSAEAQLAVPPRMFDPAAWRALGRGALHGASVHARGIAIDPAMFDRFGIPSELRGQLSVAVDVGEAGRTLQATVDVAGLRGDPIATPIDVHLAAAIDDHATTSSLTVRTARTIVDQATGKPTATTAGKAAVRTPDKNTAATPAKVAAATSDKPAVSSAGDTLLEMQAQIPESLVALIERRRADPEAAKTAPFRATVKLASVDAPRFLAVFGRTEIIAGKIDGAIELGGTLARPTARGNLTATGLKVPPGPRGKPVRLVDRLAVVGSWDGDAIKLDLDGAESEGGTMKAQLVARPAALRDGTLTVKATRFDLVPILVFAPGPAGGAAGELDADLTVTGLDLRTTKIAGELHLVEARLPVAPAVGTLRRAKIDAKIADHEVLLTIDGKLGAGTVAVTGTVALDGAAPNGGKAKITLRKVSPIGVIEPQISADISATLSHDHEKWRADLVVDNGNVVVPSERGEKLKPAGAPSDMTFSNGERVTRRPLAHREPTNPIFIVAVELHSTRVESEEFRGLIHGQVELRADGGAIGMTGGIDADRGDLDLFGRRYGLERAGVHFDGSLDPLLDIRITHDFPDVTTATEVHGRLSNPELEMSSDPGTYSQGQLLGFLLGGDPNGDPHSGTASEAATNAGTSFVAGKIGGYVRNALPVNIDVLRYEAATATSGSAVVVGSWLTHALFLAYRQHLEDRPDENTGEGQVEYWLSRRVVVEGTVGNRADGLDLLWRLRY
jgi:translocation and assembly module TamB